MKNIFIHLFILFGFLPLPSMQASCVAPLTVLALPLYFLAYIGAGLSASAPHADAISLFVLSIGLVAALVELTAKEFRLLEFFVKRAGRALTRDNILDAVWGREVMVTDRSVDRCVTVLRAKIEADPRNPAFIQTIRDIGYRFEAD